MTLADITSTLFRKNRTLVRIERTIELGAFILLNDGRYGILQSIDMIQGDKRGYVVGNGYAVSITDSDIFAFKNMANQPQIGYNKAS